MAANKDTLFTIGQFANLHKINKKTLMWYDEVGILPPAVIQENGYRYYTYYQSSVLETILLLRSLDVPIPKIREFLTDRSAENLGRLLDESIHSVDREIARLKKVKKTLLEQREDVNFLFNTDLAEISFVKRPAEHLMILRTQRDISLEKEIEMVISATKKLELEHLHDAVYGSMIAVESLLEGDFDHYEALYINPGKKEKSLHVKPAGTYLRAFCRGNWEKLGGRYREILRFARERGITLTGYAYEQSLNDMLIQDENDYITKIEIKAD